MYRAPLALIAMLATACDSKRSAPSAAAGSAASAERITDPDLMIRRAYERLDATHFVSSVTIRYVRPDGTLDPQYGELEIETGRRPPPPPQDDPNRPVGAPVPQRPAYDVVQHAMARCPRIVWRSDGVRRDTEGACSMFTDRRITAPRCTVAAVIARARTAGAIEGALATISLSAAYQDLMPQTWTFDISDPPRGIHFRHDVVDDCEPIVEKP